MMILNQFCYWVAVKTHQIPQRSEISLKVLSKFSVMTWKFNFIPTTFRTTVLPLDSVAPLRAGRGRICDKGERNICKIAANIHDDNQSANRQIYCEDYFSVALKAASCALFANEFFCPYSPSFIFQCTLQIKTSCMRVFFSALEYKMWVHSSLFMSILPCTLGGWHPDGVFLWQMQGDHAIVPC